MKTFNALIGILALLSGCGGSNGNPDGGDGNCPNLAGTWGFSYVCTMSTSGRSAAVTQDGCAIESIWKDDHTTDQDLLSGTVDQDGALSLTIDFGESQVTCTGTATATSWTAACTPDDCTLTAEKP